MGDNPDWAARRLEIILRNLERLADQFDAIKRLFPEWRDQRLLTIATIDEFEKKLDKVYKAASVASSVSSVSSLMGTISTIVAAYLNWKGVPSCSWASAGQKLSAAGNIGIPIVTLVEHGISSSYLKQCRKRVEEDKEFSQPILEFLEYTRNLDQAVQEVFGCSIYSNIWQDVVAFWEESATITVNTCRDTQNITDMLIRRMGGKIPEDILEEIGIAFRRNAGRAWNSTGSGILKTLQRIGQLLQVPHVSMAISSVRIYAQANGILRGELASPITRIDWGKASNWSIAGHGLCEALNILVDVSNLLQRSDGVLGGQSTHSIKLEDIKQGLVRELTTIENTLLLNRWEVNP